MIPNSILDKELKQLSGTELKVFLVILRQTIGWTDGKGNRKERDWISYTFFTEKAGVSRKSVSVAIQSLIEKNLIVKSDREGNHLPERKIRKRIYYSVHPQLWGKNYTQLVEKLHSTKLKQYKTKLRPGELKSLNELLKHPGNVKLRRTYSHDE